ncbi:hypothetical protein ACSLVK_04605 [Photorhabdus tasmaniensis]|uniref:hypothetical protein n=1 Tax=Photorhabdus tasmaniensis TaxID=1004159 RepID=UPI0040434BF0
MKSYLINKLTQYRGGKTAHWILTPVSNCLMAYWMNKEKLKQMHSNTNATLGNTIPLSPVRLEALTA